MEKQKFYLTTAIAYASRKPHIGNTYEIIMTDAVARYKRQRGYDVFFMTGTDEHGQKIEELAKAAIETCGESKAVILGNHGLVTCGKDLKSAYGLACNMEYCAELQYRAMCIGQPNILTKEQMDDVMEEKFHGKLVDYTDVMYYYVSLMENDPNFPERQGCVAVTKELAEILDTLMHREIFEDIINGWLKFCFYYNMLGQ